MSSADGYHPLTVAEVVRETADARSFVLDVPPALRERFAYRAGQFCTFRTRIAGREIVRCYSMSSSPDTGEPLTVTVKRVPGGAMSNWMHDTLVRGHTLDVLPPAGRFVLRPRETPIVAFAGGSGITPVLSIIKSALATTRREVLLVYANRATASIIFAAALDRLRDQADGRLALHHHVDALHGLLDASACAALVGARAHADFYVCGPAPYMRLVEAGLARRGVDAERLLIERFQPTDDAPAAAPASETTALVIRIDGRKHRVGYARGDTILDAARRAGLKPPFNCQSGTCATCMARLVAGRATMRRNDALDAGEVADGWILTCQAIPTSVDVVVDYDQ